MLPLILRVILSLCLTTNIALAISLSKPNCPEKCGNVSIPYPFGVGLDCTANSSFTITCLNSSTPILNLVDLEVISVSVYDIVIVKQEVATINCSLVEETESLRISPDGSLFTISARYNSLVVLGCKISAWLPLQQRRSNGINSTDIVGGCNGICKSNSTSKSCNGVNCCQTTIPPRLHELHYNYQSNEGIDNSTCGYVFPVDKKWLETDYLKYKGLQLRNPYDQEFRYAPLVLEWELDGQSSTSVTTCRSSDDYLPQSSSSDIDDLAYLYSLYTRYEYVSSTKYCHCDSGFEGNPYLYKGCIDIDECHNATNSCTRYNRTCINEVRGYRCEFPGEKNKTRVKIAFISVASALCSLFFLFGAWKGIQKKIKLANRKRKFYKRNGGLLLEQQLSSTENGFEKTKLFTSKKLAHATDRYNDNRILGRGGQGTVYKGMLTDGSIVAVKKSMKFEEGDLEAFINEVVIVSQINHRNVVRLLGCCLETEVPLLVYEFIPNGTLFQHIHDPREDFPLSWEMRVRIAREVAGALAYLHSAASVPIYHRDIKSTNILLDDKYRAKVSDFGTSRSVAIDQTHFTTRVLGTYGYLDPEYFESGQFTEKSDVYSFGVVMVELLTGEKAISSARSADIGRSLATHFLHSMEENQLFEILDERVLKEGKREEIVEIAELARRCLHLNGKRRPTMKEVAVELEGVQMAKEGSKVMQNQENNRESHVEVAESYDFSSVSESMHFDNIIADNHRMLS